MPQRLAGHPDDAALAPWALGLLAAALAGGGLALSNPSPAEFQAFAAERLVEEISAELCDEGGLPLLMRMAIHNCPQLVQAQRGALAAVVADHTRRSNLGVLSVYRSAVGGQTLLGWRVPRLESTVVGIAGQFVLVQASSDRASSDRASSTTEP